MFDQTFSVPCTTPLCSALSDSPKGMRLASAPSAANWPSSTLDGWMRNARPLASAGVRSSRLAESCFMPLFQKARP